MFVGESADRRSAGQRHREGAAGKTQTGDGEFGIIAKYFKKKLQSTEVKIY